MSAIGYAMGTIGYAIGTIGYAIGTIGYAIGSIGYAIGTIGYAMRTIGYAMGTIEFVRVRLRHLVRGIAVCYRFYLFQIIIIFICNSNSKFLESINSHNEVLSEKHEF